MEKREAKLKAALMEEIHQRLPSFVTWRHEDRIRSGFPDISIHGLGRVSTWEVKHATPRVSSIDLQELTCLRLAAANHCRYIIYFENAEGSAKRTLIIHPKHFEHLFPEEAWTTGYDHLWVCRQIYQWHSHGI